MVRLSSIFERVRGLWRRPPQVSVVRLAGVIGVGGLGRGGLTLDGVAPVLERAFAQRRLAAVALVINSPGGSPVQSALIAKRIRSLADEKSVPVLAFVEDVAASGGYWLACAADEIFADENSIVGSIGVITSSFGFHEMIARWGIERRLYTAGERKSLLDPFQPAKPEDLVRLKAIHADMHESFKSVVRARRGARLRLPEAEDAQSTLFSGEFWTGRRALALGLIDGLDDVRTHLRSRFGAKVRLRPVAIRESWLRRHLPRMDRGHWAVAAGGAMSAVEDRMWWARYGL